MAALLWLIFGLPLAPVRGVVALAEVLLEQAEGELRLQARRELEQLEDRVAAGELSEEEASEEAQRITERLMSSGMGG
ncbi:gas vesicle protein GvpG [Lentzea nigeriaca]|uniref:gas vesicle protein GvpG n=1 Tax=Lentzea nigeriaca TaxID=1128665 RepID=UPI0027DC5ABA|nr:gas vesicle protein GvpG [Lentzea nigeriaca]MBM7864297.1 putative membrane protein [Lentzea nigeriaca]